jgi:hypothetical protein
MAESSLMVDRDPSGAKRLLLNWPERAASARWPGVVDARAAR